MNKKAHVIIDEVRAPANQENTLDFLEKVRTKAPFLIQKIRTDQGSEFRGLAVCSYMKQQ